MTGMAFALLTLMNVLAASQAALAQDAEADAPPAACISTDPDVSDSAAWANRALSLFENEQYAEAISTVNACFRYYGPAAGQQQKVMWDKGSKCPRTGEVNKKQRRRIDANGLLNDVTLALWAKARSLHALEHVEPAKQAYAQCIYMACGRTWDPQGWYWSPAEDCAEKAEEFVDSPAAREG